MTPEEVVAVWFDRVWAQEDASAIDDMLVPDSNVLGLDKLALVGPQEFKQFHQCLLSLIKEMRFDILRQNTEDEGWVSVLFELHARRRDNGEPVVTTGHIYCRTEGDQIREGYNHVDFIRLFEQLDLMPQGSLGACLQGNRVG